MKERLLKNSLSSTIYKGVGFGFLVSTIASVILFPIHAQEDFSPAEKPAGAKSQTQEVVKSTSKPVLWKNDNSGQSYANSAVKFVLNAKDNLSQTDYIEYKIDGGDYIRYSVPIVISSDGPHSITYRSTDKAGNQEFEKSFNIIIDNTPPEVELTPSKAFIKNKDGRIFTSPGNTFTLRSIDQHSGVKKIDYSVNSTTKSVYESGRVIQLSDPGSQLIQYNATDNLGNVTQNGNVLVIVDTQSPKVNINTTKPLRQINNENYARRATGFNIIAEDDGSGVAQIMVRIDDSQEWQAYSNTIYFSAETAHKIEAKAIDAVGNESEIVVSSFKIDDNPPISKLRTSADAVSPSINKE